ncbi:DUF1294 domain-containing protein [Acinetobacter larvae]|uniref:Cold-shock protein n=1 Tax=Acinetobacter larvae TaxID=1789224 RepID=A0A1B2LW20_9GAMM|nr:DUF1294 domain-containing protein [Acinetobacter larvae]AOA57125.1 cold-shock protein [Acinetobacter larvae]
MRDQGRLIEWFDEQGYGFIQPNDAKKAKVFLHIKDFSKAGPRPIIGCALDYRVTVDGQGRYRATDVVYLKARQVRAQAAEQVVQHGTATKTALQPMQYLIAGYLIVLAILSVLGYLPSLTWIWLMLVNVLCYWCYALDKEAAKTQKRRIPEQNLHILAVLGGWPAAWLAQQRLRHKTQKQPFQKIYRFSILFNVLLLLWLLSPLNVF